MRNGKWQLKVQAYLDGELGERDRRAVESALARDPEAAALLAELRHTRSALAGFESGLRLPESREFFWSKVARAIERPALQPNRALRERLLALWGMALARSRLVPAVATAAVALTVAAGLYVRSSRGHAPAVEAAFVDPGAFTYRDYARGMTLVWLAYPAEEGFTRSEPDDRL